MIMIRNKMNLNLFVISKTEQECFNGFRTLGDS